MDARERSLPVMSRQISTTEGSEPGLIRWEADRLDRLRGVLRWSADQRALDDAATGWQSRRSDGSQKTHPLPCIGDARVSPRGGRRRGRATRTATSVSTPREEPSSSARAPRFSPQKRGFLGRSSAFFRYRSHSSFVDGRDACLVTARSPAGRDQRDPRHASASNAAADPRAARQGHMKRRSSERGIPGTRSNRSCPRITGQSAERLPVRTSGPSCTWSKRRSWP